MTNQVVPEFDARQERLAGLLTIVALFTAFAIANSPLHDLYWYIHHAPVSVQVGEFGINIPLIAWINSILRDTHDSHQKKILVF